MIFKKIDAVVNCTNHALVFSFIILTIIFTSCESSHTEPSFYFWRTKAVLSHPEKTALKEYNIKILYVRLFDVEIDPLTDTPKPLGVTDSIETLGKTISLIPVIFITNRTFLNLNKRQSSELAQNVLKKVDGLCTRYNELQIDCDWSDKTRQQYFNFLKSLKTLLSKQKKLTATIRLHQIKYPFKTGVPPVDGGMLMFYNVGNIKDITGSNSIFDVLTAQKYTPYISKYALPLDAALPIFRWCVHYKSGTVKNMITKKNLPLLSDTGLFENDNNTHLFKVKTSFLKYGIYYEKGDILKYEAVEENTLLEAARLLKQNLKPGNRRIVFFDLDELNLNYYDKKTLETIFNTFN